MPRAAWISGCTAGRDSPQVTSQRLTTLLPRHADIVLWVGTLYLPRGQLAAVARQRWKTRALQPDLREVSRLLKQAYAGLQHAPHAAVNAASP